jgi:hypothetical protein
MNPQSLIRMVSAVLTPDLLRPKYKQEAAKQCREYGHCYIATEALWHLLGGPKSGYTPKYAFDCENDTHWWLAHNETQDTLDPTAPQYTAKERKKLYAEGKPCGFLTRKPSKRAQVIMDRVEALRSIVGAGVVSLSRPEP